MNIYIVYGFNCLEICELFDNIWCRLLVNAVKLLENCCGCIDQMCWWIKAWSSFVLIEFFCVTQLMNNIICMLNGCIVTLLSVKSIWIELKMWWIVFMWKVFEMWWRHEIGSVCQWAKRILVLFVLHAICDSMIMAECQWGNLHFNVMYYFDTFCVFVTEWNICVNP